MGKLQVFANLGQRAGDALQRLVLGHHLEFIRVPSELGDSGQREARQQQQSDGAFLKLVQEKKNTQMKNWKKQRLAPQNRRKVV
jgi:hypothetical protein